MPNFLFSLRGRVLLLFGVLFAVFFGAEWVHLDYVRGLRLKATRHELLGDARSFASRASQFVDHGREVLDGLVQAQQLRPTLASGACRRRFSRQLGDDPEIANAIVIAPDGDVTCSVTPLARPLSVADRPYFRQALISPGIVVGKTIVGRISGNRLLPVIEAVRDASGRPRDAIAVMIDLSRIARALANSKHPADASFGLFDAKGRVLARGLDVEKGSKYHIVDPRMFQALAARSDGGVFNGIGVDGVSRIYGVARFAATTAGPIWFWYGLNKRAVTADIESEFVWSIAASLGLLAVLFALVWIGGDRLILHPISILAAAAERLAQGNLSARTGLEHGPDELGRLTRSFDHMAASLEARNHDVLLASRAVKVLSTWNRTLVESMDEKTLGESMCRAIVETGGYRGAWVGIARSDENKTVEPVAWWGIDPEFVANLDVTWADNTRGRGPAGTATRTGTPVTMNDYMTNPDTALRHERARRYQLNSISSFPLKVDGAVIGALSIYATESESFGEQEAVLLTEVAATLSSGIAALRARAARARLELSLKRSENRFRAAADASPDALFVFKSVRDSAGNVVDLEIVEMNARAAQQIGMSRKDAIGKTYLGLLPLYATRGSFEQYVRVVNTGTRFEGEFSYDVPQKGQRWFRQQVVRVGDGIAISLRDVTSWKTAGERIREAEERMRLALRGARMGAWSADGKDLLYSFTEETESILGLPKGAGPQSLEAFARIVHPEDREALTSGIKRSWETSRSARREFRVIWPDGTIHWVESHGDFICDETGKPVRSIGVIADITQRKLDVLALERANRALKTLSAGNEALVRAVSEPELLREVCRVIVEKGGYRLVWVGYAQDDPQKTITTMARFGIETEWVSPVRHSWADNEEGQRAISRAIRSGKAEVARDVQGDPAYASVKELMARRGFASNLALPLLERKKVIGAISIHAAEADAFDEAEVTLLQELANDLAYGIVTLRTREERNRIALAHERDAAILRKSLEDGIQAIAATVEMRDPYTSGHQQRVARLAVALAKEIGLSEERIHGLHLAGIVHDLGKISVPAEILAKPGKLTSVELELIRGHAQAGYEILKDIDFPWPIAAIVLQHHERFDGSGYPQGLKGEDILLESRIMAVADVVEAMASHRPYRATLGIDVALQEIERGSGTRYDPAVAGACLRMFGEGRYVLGA